MVKKYRRPAAGKSDPSPHELRPPDVLQITVNYLIDNIVSKKDCAWSLVYEYVFDRFRAVRQDLVIQRLQGPETIDILQKVVRFHVYAHYKLCTEPVSKFDPKINETHIQECLKRLLVLYGVEGFEHHVHSAEFLAVYLLFNLGSWEALCLALQVKHSLGDSRDLVQAMAISLAWWTGNYVRVIRLARRLQPLQACALHKHFTNITRQALCSMCSGFHSKVLTYPVDQLTSLLGQDDLEITTNACQQLGLQVDSKGVHFIRGSIKSDTSILASHYSFIDYKLAMLPPKQLIHGISHQKIENNT